MDELLMLPSLVLESALAEAKLLFAGRLASAWSKSNRGKLKLLRVSVTLDTLLFVKRLWSWLAVSEGKAARKTAIAPATCGAACEVPLEMMPAEVMLTPGANRVRKLALFEKHTTLSAAVVASVQPVPQLMPPSLLSYTAPTDTASGAQAGLLKPSI